MENVYHLFNPGGICSVDCPNDGVNWIAVKNLLHRVFRCTYKPILVLEVANMARLHGAGKGLFRYGLCDVR